jgi:GTPase SAR1 family protein
VKGSYENVGSTIGVEFAYKIVMLKNRTKVKAQIWDTCKYLNILIICIAGSEKYKSITTGHYRFALGAILVYDISNADSFKNCRMWLDYIR